MYVKHAYMFYFLLATVYIWRRYEGEEFAVCVYGHADNESPATEQSPCKIETTQWSSCSVSCGMGVSIQPRAVSPKHTLLAWLIDWLIDWHVVSIPGHCHISVIYWLNEWINDWLIDWLIDWRQWTVRDVVWYGSVDTNDWWQRLWAASGTSSVHRAAVRRRTTGQWQCRRL